MSSIEEDLPSRTSVNPAVFPEKVVRGCSGLSQNSGMIMPEQLEGHTIPKGCRESMSTVHGGRQPYRLAPVRLLIVCFAPDMLERSRRLLGIHLRTVTCELIFDYGPIAPWMAGKERPDEG